MAVGVRPVKSILTVHKETLMKSVIVSCLVLLISSPLFSQQPLLVSEHAQTPGAKSVMFGVGAGFFSKDGITTSSMPQSEWRVGVFALRVGVAHNVNFDIEWRGRLFARIGNGTQANDWGDMTIATKINVLDEQETSPALGIRSAVKLPNTTYTPHKLGSNQTDYFFHILLTKEFSVVELRAAVGLGIVGSPVNVGSQDDIYITSVAALFPVSQPVHTFVELYGFTGSSPENNKLTGRVGVIADLPGLECGIFGSRRLLGDNRDFASAFEASEDWGGGIFVAKRLKL